MMETPVNADLQDAEGGAFQQLHECASSVASELMLQRRSYDSYLKRIADPNKPARRRLLGLGGHRAASITETPEAWRMNSLRLAETSTFTPEDLEAATFHTKYVQRDDELWLQKTGEILVLSFRLDSENAQKSLSVSSAQLTELTAARYDCIPSWKTRQISRGPIRVEEGWLEMLGKPWYQAPFGSITKMLTDLQKCVEVPSSVF